MIFDCFEPFLTSKFTTRRLLQSSFTVTEFKFASLVTLVQRYVSTELEARMPFLFRENRRHGTGGQTDGRYATLNAAAYGGPYKKAFSLSAF